MNFDTWLYWNHVKTYANGRKCRRKARYLKKYFRVEKRYQPEGFSPNIKRKSTRSC